MRIEKCSIIYVGTRVMAMTRVKNHMRPKVYLGNPGELKTLKQNNNIIHPKPTTRKIALTPMYHHSGLQTLVPDLPLRHLHLIVILIMTNPPPTKTNLSRDHRALKRERRLRSHRLNVAPFSSTIM